ncbi:hypothetical protein CHUAL_002299 [Chamberlinius hualienensis]
MLSNCFQLILVFIGLANFSDKLNVETRHPNEYNILDDFISRVESEFDIHDTVFNYTAMKVLAPTSNESTTPATLRKPLEGTKVSPHLYMKTLFDEIDEKRNEDWTNMNTPGATVRGIEPIKVTNSSEINDGIALDFAIGTINDFNAIPVINLVLTSPFVLNETNNDRVFTVHFLSPNRSATSHNLTSSRKLSSADRKWSFSVLEMTHVIRDWWNKGYLEAIQTIHLSPSNMYKERPILIFYYFSKNAMMNIRQKRTPICEHGCATATRTDPTCDLQNLVVTVQELQWEKVVLAPTSFKIDYCDGSCKAPIFDATYHAVVRSLIVAYSNSRSFLSPKCVPISFGNQNFIFLRHGGEYIQQMTNVVAKQCGCR